MLFSIPRRKTGEEGCRWKGAEMEKYALQIPSLFKRETEWSVRPVPPVAQSVFLLNVVHEQSIGLMSQRLRVQASPGGVQ